MSVNNPLFGTILRQSVVGQENEWVKMFDPPTASPATPELVNPTNPVPEVMAAAGLANVPVTPHTILRGLMHGTKRFTWDGLKELVWFEIHDSEIPAAAGGVYPGCTTRIPRGVIFHGKVLGHGTPPHTIHWHGIEPTPINDGVGHCSMEIGNYTYQFQPNFIGTYFYHCHRNTVQHFNYGLYGLLPVMPPDAYFATQWNPAIPIGAGRDGRFRMQANVSLIKLPTGGGVPMDAGRGIGFEGATIPNPFPGFIGGNLNDPDPEALNNNLPASLKFQTNPHAMTVPYDVEAIWVFADRDSVWSDLAPSPFTTFPRHGNVPGVDDRFDQNPGGQGFFAFNQFNPDYWFVTGVPVPAHRGETGRLPATAEIPAALNSGMSGVQVPINAKVGQTIFLRCLNGAYDVTETTFPCDVTIIAWDGRSLGVPPYAFNHPYRVPAGTPIRQSVARRFGALIRSDVEVHGVATVKFCSARHGGQATAPVAVTAEIPINIGPNVQAGTFSISGTATAATSLTLVGPGGNFTTVADAAGNYSFTGLANGDYVITPFLTGSTFAPRSLSVTIAGANVTGQNFARAQATGAFAISGSVTFRGIGIPGVSITARGPVVQTVVTDAQGNYTLSGLPNGRYSVQPVSPDFSRFTPSLRGATVNGANVLGRNFRAVF